MNKQEMLDFISKNPIGFLATAEDNKPHVRAFGMYRADDKGIIYFTQTVKDVYKQLAKNPQIEVCYWANGVQLRVAGKITFIDDMEVKKGIVAAAPFLQPQVDANGWDYLKPFLLKGKGCVIDGPPGAPKNWVEL
jgi:pyridoxamine 5'-phosphate oxidase